MNEDANGGGDSMNLHELDPAIRDAMLQRLKWPSILTETVGAFVVDSSAFDPATLVERTPPRDWFCLKWGGSDFGGQESFKKTFHYLRSNGHFVGAWLRVGRIPNDDVGSLIAAGIMVWPRTLDFVVFDCEDEFKGDGFGNAQSLVDSYNAFLRPIPAAILSYGKADVAMDLGEFLLQGWPVFPMCYDAFTPADANSYLSEFWIPSQIHPTVRTLHPDKGQSIYRPEGLDP